VWFKGKMIQMDGLEEKHQAVSIWISAFFIKNYVRVFVLFLI